mmetsp:Transcript_130012/g.324015  ORF Transcript_130012/g.324015 Transcript_130012/m.324015 type:complete len:219 (+) Transcript_130012:87-743(+)
MARGQSSSVVAVLAAGVVLLTQRSFLTTFCGGPAAPGRSPRSTARPVSSTDVAIVESEASSPGISEPLRLASGGMSLLKPVFAAEAQLQAGSYDQEEIRALIQEEANSAPVVLYTYSLSPFSSEATRLLTEAGVEYKEIELAPEWFLMLGEPAAKRAELGAMTGRTSLPHIFINGESIGGLYDGTPGLVALIESGELQAKVQGPKEESLFDNLMGMFR